jgi:chorismate dehydratase
MIRQDGHKEDLLRIGEIPYLNTLPIFTALKNHFDTGNLEFVQGHPRELNQMLRNGQIDISPSSSIEYGKHSEGYLLIPDLSISSREKVHSVLLFSTLPLDKEDNFTIFGTSRSETSLTLARIIFSHFWRKQVRIHDSPSAKEEGIREGNPYLLIGDEAILELLDGSRTSHVYDLGEIWYRNTGLPFAFALWIVNKDSYYGNKNMVKKFCRKLLDAKRISKNIVRFGDRKMDVPGGLPLGFLLHYWSNLSYDLEIEIEGLRLFFTLAREVGELKEEPALNFIDLP